MSFDISGHVPVPEARRKAPVSPVARVHDVEGANEAQGRALAAVRGTPLGPVYVFAQNMGLIQNRTLLIMQSRQIREITRQGDLFEKEDVRKKFSNALVMVAAHSPEELDIFLLTTQRMASSGYADRLSMFFEQVTEALTERLKKKPGEETDPNEPPPFPMPESPEADLVAQVRRTLEKRFEQVRQRAYALGIVEGEQPSEALATVLKSGEMLIANADPAPETVLDLLTS